MCRFGQLPPTSFCLKATLQEHLPGQLDFTLWSAILFLALPDLLYLTALEPHISIIYMMPSHGPVPKHSTKGVRPASNPSAHIAVAARVAGASAEATLAAHRYLRAGCGGAGGETRPPPRRTGPNAAGAGAARQAGATTGRCHDNGGRVSGATAPGVRPSDVAADAGTSTPAPAKRCGHD